MDKPIKLLTLNVSLFDENNDKLTSFLQEVSPDIVCLQEVTRKVDKSAYDGYISKDAIDNALPSLSSSFYAANWALKDFRQHNFHGKELFQYDFGGIIEYGNYVRSRFPITSGRGVFVQDNFSYITDWDWIEKHEGEEPRMVEIADVAIGDTQKLRIINYHGIWSKDKKGNDRTLAASQKILQFAQEVNYPVIICGDFNLFPDTQSMQIVQNHFTSLVDTYEVTHTRPMSNELSGSKRNVVDYIFVSKDINVKSFQVIESDASDHLPLVMEFQLFT